MAPDTAPLGQSNSNEDTQANGSTLAAARGAGLGGVTNGTHKTVAAAATNGSANGDKTPAAATMPSAFFGHSREEVTRILMQALSDMGYNSAAESVSQHSGYRLENPTVAAFRAAVLGGSWAQAEDLLTGATLADGSQGGNVGRDETDNGNGLVLATGSDRDIMRFWLRQQKFLELLEERDTTNALYVIRNDLTPLHHDTSKLHFLSSLLMCASTEDLMEKASWDGAAGESRKKLLSELSSKSQPLTH